MKVSRFDFTKNRLVGVIEVMGTICAGKMTLIESLKRKLPGANPEIIAKDLTITIELPKPKSYQERQILLGNLVLTSLLKSHENLVIVHRGLYDAIVFMSAYIEAGLAKKEEVLDQISTWYQFAEQMTDLVVFVRTPVEVAFKRARKKFAGLFQLEEKDAIFERSFFEILEKCYLNLMPRISSQKVKILDGTKTADENAREILEWISFLSFRNPEERRVISLDINAKKANVV